MMHKQQTKTTNSAHSRAEVTEMILLGERPQILAREILGEEAALPDFSVWSKIPRLPVCRWWALSVICGCDLLLLADMYDLPMARREELRQCRRLYRLGPAADKTALKLKLRHALLNYGALCEAFTVLDTRFAGEVLLVKALQESGEPYRPAHLRLSADTLNLLHIPRKKQERLLDELLMLVIQNPEYNERKTLMRLAQPLASLL